MLITTEICCDYRNINISPTSTTRKAVPAVREVKVCPGINSGQ